jgi:hypothetical protein
VIDWKQSLPQIIATIIGSGLIVTAVSSLIFRPIVDISADPYPADKNVQNMKYTISLKNNGYAPATHLRLTMSYPGAKIGRTSVDHKDENMTVKNESEGTSVVAFSPRVTSGGSFSVDTSINRTPPSNSSRANFPLADFGSNKKDYYNLHSKPYFFIATYDQGSTKFNPPSRQVNGNPSYSTSFNSNLLLPLSLFLLAFLSFAIALRRKRRSKSGLASDILTDVMKVQNELINNYKGDPNAIILRLHAWRSDIDNERQIVSEFRDYQKIDDFYSEVKSRNWYLRKPLRKQVNVDVLNTWNQDCLTKATIIDTEIDWRKFHKLDLVLLIPAIVLGTLLMDAAVEELSIIFTTYTINSFPLLNVPYSVINVYYIIFSGISSFFIIRLILKASQGVIVDKYGLPHIFRSPALLLYCFVIVGIIPFLVNLYVLNHIFSIDYKVAASFIVDIGSMFLLTWVVWKHYIKRTFDDEKHFIDSIIHAYNAGRKRAEETP